MNGTALPGKPLSTVGHPASRPAAKDFPIGSSSTWICFRCGKVNVVRARFCGRCGVGVLWLMQPPSNATRKSSGLPLIKEPIPGSASFRLDSPKGGGQTWQPLKRERPIGDLPGLSDDGSARTSKPASRRLPSNARFNRRTIVRWSRIGGKFALIAVVILTFLPFLIATTQATPESSIRNSKVVWFDFQSYLSQNLGVTISEVEVLARDAWGEIPDSQMPLTVEQVRMIEETLNRKTTEKFRILPVGLKNGRLTWANLDGGSVPIEGTHFSDVPLDHPVYLAWGALLKLGLNLSCENSEARPYASIRWDEWTSVIKQLGRLRGNEGRGQVFYGIDRSGEMDTADLIEALSDLRSKVGLSAGSQIQEVSAESRLTRIEAFGSLANLLTELEKHDSASRQ